MSFLGRSVIDVFVLVPSCFVNLASLYALYGIAIASFGIIVQSAVERRVPVAVGV